MDEATVRQRGRGIAAMALKRMTILTTMQILCVHSVEAKIWPLFHYMMRTLYLAISMIFFL